MAYSAKKHDIFSQRIKNFAISFEGAMVEAKKLDQVYINEGASGSATDFVGNGTATKQEHIDLIVLIRAFVDFTEGSAAAPQLDRRPNLTAFTQNVPV